MAKSQILLISKLALILLLTISGISSKAQWQQKSFIIGTFYDPQMPTKSFKDTVGYAAKIRNIKNGYFNLMTGLNSWYGDTSFVNYYLKVISDAGLKTLVMNERFLAKKGSLDQNATNQWFNYLKNLDPVRKKAMMGYLVFDEPAINRADYVSNLIVNTKKANPDALAYVNMAGSFVYNSRSDFESILNTYANLNGPNRLDVLSYDFYPFIKGGIKPDYFYNMYMFNKKSNGRPVWCYVLTTAHREYVEVGNYELNFMVFAPLIYGTKGILYFTYATIVGSNMPYSNALVDPQYKPTSKYYHVKAINKWITEVWGPIVMNSDRLGTYHVSSQPYDQSIQPDEKITSNTPVIANIDNKNIAVGVFRSRRNPKEINLLVMNKAAKDLKGVNITLKDINHANSVTISNPFDGAAGFNAVTNPKMDQARKIITFPIDLRAGEGRIIKVIK